MRSPRGCRSPCRFKVRAPNRFNWHLRPWTQHKSLRRAERGSGGGKWRRNNRIICICNTLLGQFLDSKWIWTHNDCNVSKSGGISLTNSDGRAWKTSWTPHATVEYSQRKKDPMGVWREQFKQSFDCRAQQNPTPLKMVRSEMGMFCDLPLQSSFNL